MLKDKSKLASMFINKVEIRNLYGFMTKTLTMKSNVSILVGINGSGKTSILNAISWILKPSFKDLCLNEFESIVLYFSYKEDDYVLSCTQDEIEVAINLKNITKDKTFNKIQATIKTSPKRLTKNINLKESLSDSYDNLGPEEHEKETWAFLFNEIPKPVIIGLDRSLYTQEGEELHLQPEYTVDHVRLFKNSKRNGKSPLDKVKSLLNAEHNNYRNNVLQVYSSLNEKIMLSAFDDLSTVGNVQALLKDVKPSIETIDLLNAQVIRFLQENHTFKQKKTRLDKKDVSVVKVNNYFINLKKIIKATEGKGGNNNLLYLANISQFRKINSLIDEFGKFETDIKDLYQPLKEFIDTLNKFFLDSAKQLYFDKHTSEIRFNILDKKGDVVDGGRDVSNLSSGEKQILILLTYLKYNSNQNLFIIDEPELSLHPKWQAEFLDAVDRVMDKSTQLVIATHSPEIIGDRRDNCSVLLPYNV